MNVFDNREAQAMLIADLKDPFDSEDYLYELKFDGIRLLAYIDENKTDLRNKRNKELTPIFPELKNLHQYVKKKCILDGELIVFKNGKPDFYEVQKRAMMTNLFKIDMLIQKNHASYIVYDILYIEDHLLIEETIENRKEILNQIIEENSYIAISKVHDKGIALFGLVKQLELEGVVAKRRKSQYFFGKRTKDWVKFKLLEDDDFIICGYIPKQNQLISIILGQYSKEKELIYKGHCSLGCSDNLLKQHPVKKINHSPFNIYPNGNEEAIWLQPELVCIVEYMPSEKGLRQPVFKGIRDDKSSHDCIE